MSKIAIITDTDACLPQAIAREYGIRQVPITIHFDGSMYTTGVDIDDRKVFELIDRANKIPTTSAPSPGSFLNAYQDAFKAGADSVVCLCVSSKISATYDSAVNARNELKDRDITVVDTLNLSMGQGFMVLAAAEAARAGATPAEAAAAALAAGRNMHLYAVLPTLKYLALSGRVGKLMAGIAGTLNIMPILTVKEGKLDLLERIRTRKKAIERLLELVHTAVGGRRVTRAAIIHVNNPEGARELAGLLCAGLPCPQDLITAEFSPGLSVHAGSGVVGVALQTA
jgi:DegV family protein with EDD domain